MLKYFQYYYWAKRDCDNTDIIEKGIDAVIVSKSKSRKNLLANSNVSIVP